jgi:hypothetical protein
MTKSQAMGFSLGHQGTFTREIIIKTNEMGMGKCTGTMEAIIKASGEREFSMERAR